MKASIQFFMIDKDTQQFLSFVEKQVDRIEANAYFHVGDCQIHFVASQQIENTLLAGQLSINSGGLDHGCQNQNRANNIYRKLRKKIKNTASNRLSTWIVGNENKVSRERNYWLAQEAKRWKEMTATGRLKPSKNSQILFDIAPEFVKMGTIKPKNERFKFRGA